MRRLMLALFAIGLLMLLPFTLTAQVPVTTEEPQPGTATEAPPAVNLPPNIAPLPTALDATPAPVSPISSDALPILINARTDLELLATQALGTTRPDGWSGSLDVNDPQLPILIRLDLELLVGVTQGVNSRPAGWFGPVPSSPYAIARDIRHDLELLADLLNPPNVRPAGWVGSDPLLRCERGVQTLVSLLEKNASQYTEQNLLANPVAPSLSGGAAVQGGVRVTSQFAVAFLSRFGNQQVGTIPVGEIVKPIARSYTQFSKMILVQGSGFEVFMDYRDTTLTDTQFIALDNIDAISVNPACGASWCKAPSG